MRMLIKRLLRKHKYPPEGMEDAVQTVMTQCELWADQVDFENVTPLYDYANTATDSWAYAAEPEVEYHQ